jgi:hypothetical protein
MSYNGSGTFNINSAGQPVVSGTVISSTAFNALTSDLATGLSTALTKDGQTTPTANIKLGGYKITNLAAGTAATDAVRFDQLTSAGVPLITVAGTADAITGTITPSLTAYTTGGLFSFVVGSTNTTAVTLNIDGVGVKAVTRTGSTALVAGDMVTGQVVLVEYDGTRFQLLNGNSFTNLNASGTLGVTGATTLSSTLGVTGLTTLGVTGASFPGSTSGTAKIVAPAVAGTTTFTLPATTDTLVGKATTDTLTNKTLAVTGNTFNFTPITASLGADVSMSVAGTYYDGPSIAQGTSGTWLAMGTITVLDSNASNAKFKMWDGTTVIDSGRAVGLVTNGGFTFHFSGYIVSPAGNLRISASNDGNTSGKIVFNASGNSKDSTITAIRIA